MSIDALTTVADFREAPDQCSPGDQQRLRIHVPKVSTTLSMGAKAPPGSIRDLDAGAPNYDGFGVFTLGHIHLSASDTPSTSTIGLDAKGDITIQSEQERLFMGAKKQAVLASGGNNAYVIGGTGVVIAGGTEVPWADIVKPDGTTPLPPAWKDNFTATADSINRAWSGIDAFVALSTGIYNVGKLALGWSGSFWDKFSVAGLLAGNFGGLAVSGLGALGGPTIGGTVIHGSGGLVMGSPHTASIYSLTGLTLASVLGTTMLSGAVGILGIGEVSVQSKQKVELTSMNEAAMSAFKKVHVDAGINAVYGGRYIEVGEHPKHRKWPTQRVDISAASGIELLADSGAKDVLGAMSAARDLGVVRIGAPKHVAIGADEQVSLGIKSGGELALRVTNSPTDFVKLKKDLIDVESTSQVRLKAGSTAVDVKTDSIAFVVGSMQAKLDRSSFVTPGGKFRKNRVKLHASKIELG